MSIKLSEACRLGPTIIPTIYGPIFKRDWRGKVCGACRIGSVALAAGYQPKRVVLHQSEDSRAVYDFFRQTWPWVDEVSKHEYNVLYLFGVVSYIAYSHEVAKLTADEIARNIEVLEAKYANNTVTIHVTPNRAGDALQPTEVL